MIERRCCWSRKGWPDPKHPVALNETVIEVSDYKWEVRRRLKRATRQATRWTIPAPACVSTTEFQFTGCPFALYCREEVRVIERKRRRAEARNAAEPKVAISSRSRNNRSGKSAR